MSQSILPLSVLDVDIPANDDRGVGNGLIPGNSDLFFEVELQKIN
jgi:FKBP-type peptidyl-prolyl cis-trans isomerase